MYEALVARVRYHIQKANFMGLKEAESTLLLGETADAIEELSHENESLAKSVNEAAELLHKRGTPPKWIPVTKRLPDAHKEVYVTDGEYIARANLLDEVFPGDKPCWSYSGLGEITDWCEQIPLPQPPKEET